MNIKQMIDIVLESNGGLNLYVKNVRDKIVSEITERVCLDEGYENVFGKNECDEIRKTVEERNERIVAQNNDVVEEPKKTEEPVIQEKEKNVNKSKKSRRVKRKNISQFTR